PIEMRHLAAATEGRSLLTARVLRAASGNSGDVRQNRDAGSVVVVAVVLVLPAIPVRRRPRRRAVVLAPPPGDRPHLVVRDRHREDRRRYLPDVDRSPRAVHGAGPVPAAL